nr:4Fe-4S binding protein [Candidatus Omnitrophota bacterium]
MKKLVLIRRFSQILFLSLFIYILWLTTNTAVFFKIDPLVSIFSLSALTMLVLTFIVGRFFCGWICPLGAIIDICGVKAKNRDLGFRQIKYYILGFIVISTFFGMQIAWIFDPLVITARFISLNFIPSVVFMLDKFFISIIKGMNFYTPLYDFYRFTKSSILGIKIYYFPHSFITLGFFLIILGLLVIAKRFWCRILCPLGAIYALIAKFSILRRHVDKCMHCMKCSVGCRMSAIKEDTSYRKEECILCMDCIYGCPDRATKFIWPVKKIKANEENGISRRDFLFLITASFLLLGFKSRTGGAKKRLIRPPGVTSEREFLNKCIRCGNCMRVCPTNGLQPVIFESGLAGIWIPHLVPEIGYCEYNCNLCCKVCPTGAIPKLNLVQKKEHKLGLADIDKNICIPWSQNKECIVCEEHCPVPTKAIKTYDEFFAGKKIKKPYVDTSLCVGCGICQNKCPTRPERAIKVSP